MNLIGYRISKRLRGIATISVNENITITGSVVDNQLVGIEGHAVSLSIEGVNLGVVFTDASGNFEYQYIVPDLFTIGNHTITADVNSQGYYREGTGNATFFLAHRTGVSIDLVDGRDITRGERWTASGRLFDIDDPNQIGLSGMQVDVYLDGELIGSIYTASQKKDKTKLTRLSKRCSRNCGMV